MIAPHYIFHALCFKKRKVGLVYNVGYNVNERLIIETKVTFRYPCFDFQTDMDWTEDTQIH